MSIGLLLRLKLRQLSLTGKYDVLSLFLTIYFLIFKLSKKIPSKTNKNRLNLNFIYKVVYSYD